MPVGGRNGVVLGPEVARGDNEVHVAVGVVVLLEVERHHRAALLVHAGKGISGLFHLEQAWKSVLSGECPQVPQNSPITGFFHVW